ncbi:FAD-dependent oxidoreductase [Synechococcus sp. CBW1004]|nr:FAD-dependent oxidoreductase [Synechococcus sp. CBW1004]
MASASAQPPPSQEAAPQGADPARPPLQEAVDVVVVGAGLAGLTAAGALQRAGLSVRVLEAAPRAGGRLRRTRLEWPGGRAWVDLGGQWVGPTQTRMLALLDRAGLERFPSPHGGETVLHFSGERCTFSGFFQGFPEGQPPAVPQEDWDDAMQALERFNALAAALPADGHPHRAAGAAELDRRSFQEWIDANTRTPFARWYFAYFCRAVGFLGPAEPEQVSLLHVLWGQRSAPQAEHPEEELIHGGAGALLPHLLGELGAESELDAGTVRLEEPVQRIVQDDASAAGDASPAAAWPVRVESSRASHPCRAVIVAMPPSQASAIAFTPELPADRRALQAGMAMGCCAKVLIAYASPWWREQGLSGIGIGDLPTLELCADSSDPRSGAGVLATFVVGHRHGVWSVLDAERRRQAVLDDLVALFGPRAASPLAYQEQDWPREPFVGGAYAAWMPPGLWSAAGEALRRPHGRVYWAGTETATRWAGFFDGAVRSGEAAAEAVRQALSDNGQRMASG